MNSYEEAKKYLAEIWIDVIKITKETGDYISAVLDDKNIDTDEINVLPHLKHHLKISWIFWDWIYNILNEKKYLIYDDDLDEFHLFWKIMLIVV